GDFLLIFVFKMGIAGAGLSTAISQFISFCILLSMYLRGKTQARLSIKNVCLRGGYISNIVLTGFPSLIRQCLNSLATILLNYCAARYGDAAVAAMSIVSRITFFTMSIAIGIGQGFQPVSAFNFGAGHFDRVKKAFKFTLMAAEVVVIVFGIPLFIFAEPLTAIFRDDPEVIHYAIRALRLQTVAFMVMPLCMALEMGFQSTGQRLYASLLSSLRSGLLFVPSLLILSKVRGMAGIQEAQPLALFLSFIIGLFYMRKYYNLMDEKAQAATG
ncbi:MAG: MATE family efflux transporter, partial [Lachnospiraceae bacterium]|nr:MATE family efflux transporter [Candidatus Equihabitans merdae]